MHSDQPGNYVLDSGMDFVRVLVNTPPYQRNLIQIGDQTYDQISMPGIGRMNAPGYPELLRDGIFVALPPGGMPALTIEGGKTEQIEDIRIAPSKQVQLVDYADFSLQTTPNFDLIYPQNGEAYQSDSWYPEMPASLGDVSWLRDQRVVQIVVTPAQWRAADRRLLIHEQIIFRIDFTYPDGEPPLDQPRLESPQFEAMLQRNILNYAQARLWRQPRSAPSAGLDSSNCLIDDKSFRVSLRQSGIYELTYTELTQAGLPAAVDASTLKLCYQGDEIAILVKDQDSDNVFEGGDAVLFYGEEIKTQETETNVYILKYGGGAGLRMSQENADPVSAPTPTDYLQTIRLEQDGKYYSLFPTADINDHWYWGTPMDSSGLISGAQSYIETQFAVENRSAAGMAQVEAQLWGFLKDESHKYQLLINGYLIGVDSFEGSGRDSGRLFSAAFNNAILNDGANNTLRIEALTASNGSDHLLLLDWVKIAYRRAHTAVNERIAFTQSAAGNWQFHITGFTGEALLLDITNPQRPIVALSSANNGTVQFNRNTSGETSYALASSAGQRHPDSVEQIVFDDLRNPNQQADYIIITDPYFDAALAPLIAHRSAEYTVRKIYVSDIFDQFNDGRYQTNAIRDFLAYAYSNWQAPAPQYVLLAGEGTYDHRNVMGLNGASGNLVPVYLRSGIDSNIGEAASDNQYVNLPEPLSFGGDDLADMFLGRLPATTAAEMSLMVDKIINFENNPIEGWRANHIFLVDNGFEESPYGGDCSPDPAADFFYHVDEFLAEHFPADRQLLHRFYYAPPNCYPRPNYETYESYYAPSVLEVTARFIDQFDRQGDIFMSYVGHSSVTQYGEDGGIWHVTNVPLMQNGDKTPISLPMTCLAGTYHLLDNAPSLEEAMLKQPGGGTVASYAPTGLQVQTSHDYLLEGFYDAIYDDGVETLGEAVMSAKVNLYQHGSPNFQDLQDTYMILGDPALKLRLLQLTDHSYLPIASQ